MIPKSGYRFSEEIMLQQEHDPEKCIPVFRKRSCSNKSMIPKSGYRFSEKIMLQQEHDPEKWIPVFGKDHAPTLET
jgi:DNA-binding winged helix-turn-helix (wHTH) protein